MSSIYVSEPPTKGKVIVQTTYGPLDIELWPKEAPKAVRNFVQLCLEGYYNNTIFHRIIKSFLVQAGDPTGTGSGGESIYGGAFSDEFHSRLRFNHRGLVACANAGSPHSNGSQFFISLDRCEWLDRKNTIFGKVTGDSIYNLLALGEVETGKDDRPLDSPPKVTSVEVLWNPFDDIIPREISATLRSEAPPKASMAMAAAAAATAASMAFSSLQITRRPFFTVPRIAASLTQSSHLNISFAPPSTPQTPKPKPLQNPIPEPEPEHSNQPEPMLIPWIVRDENGNLTLQTTPPARLLHAMADAKTQAAKKKINKTVKEKAVSAKAAVAVPSAPPKYSKAARRFYNQKFREPQQRLSKVLAAAGVASRRSCEELIFGGQVTVNGSMCNTPQSRVDPAKDIIYVKGKRLAKRLPPKVYLALNKPKGYICSSGEKEYKSVMCLFDDYMKSWKEFWTSETSALYCWPS